MSVPTLSDVAVVDDTADQFDADGNFNAGHDIRQLARKWFAAWLTDQMTPDNVSTYPGPYGAGEI